MKNFALIGVAGYIAPRHLKAISETGNRLVAAVDPHDSVGILDRYFLDTSFFTEIERFDRFLEKLRRRDPDSRVEYVSICSPNYLHDAHVRLALRVGAHAICEKPLVLSPWNVDQLAEIEGETGCKVYNVLQLRLHDTVRALKAKYEAAPQRERANVCLTYITRRGLWYQHSWKGSVEKSGGLVTNIGIHFFDMLIWLFGAVEHSELHLSTPSRVAGRLELEGATVTWFLSSEASDLPPSAAEAGQAAYRSITIDGEEVEFSDGFAELHTRVYEAVLQGKGFGLEDARPSIEVVHRIRTSEVGSGVGDRHPLIS
jgi:UDP-N-acetyl-2-amino-2-deoxyglucuronate dehydrogenase